MLLTEEDLNQQEARIPLLADRAFREAFARALATGQPVTVLQGNEVVRITQDGAREVVERLPTRLPVAGDTTLAPTPTKKWRFRVR